MSLAATRPRTASTAPCWAHAAPPYGAALPRRSQQVGCKRRRCVISCTSLVVTDERAAGNGNVAGVLVAKPVAGASYVAPATLAAPEPVPGVLPPGKAYAAVLAAGAAKAALPWRKIFTMGVLAGGYIGFGGLLAMCVGGACPGLVASNPGLQKLLLGAFGLPFGLTMVLVCGGELFTGNTALVGCALLEGRATPQQLAKSWFTSYAGNFVGSLALVALVAGSGLLAPEAAAAKAAKAVAIAKTSLPFTQALIRGIMCNWLVCIAIWQATASTTFTGKFLGAFLPVSAFVAMGMEHSIANMAMVPLGMAAGAPVSFSTFLTANLLPVTLGNILGGFCCVALPYTYIFGKLKQQTQ